MATTVHLPDELLAAIDRRSAELGMSRNRFIRQALERAIEREGWSPAFLATLAEAHEDREGHELVEAMRHLIATGRSSRRPFDL